MEVSENEMKQRPGAPAEPSASSERTPDKHEDGAPASRGRRVVRAVGRGVRKAAREFMWVLVVSVVITIITTMVGINATRVIGPVSGPVVTDFTHLYRIEVGREIAPTQETHIVDAIRTTTGPVSIGG